MKEFETYTLPNGIRGIHRQTRSNVAHCALVVNAGSRDERRSEYGIAHFTEHALFKGTRRRRAYQVNCRLENLGGELNAYTTKEDTTLHATTLRSDFSKAVELIADIAFHSTFPERELAKEREVIADEINTYKDSPAEMIYDSFEDMIFADSELGHNILGSKASLARYTTQHLTDFVSRTYTTDQMVFSSIGGFSARTAQQTAMRYLSEASTPRRGFERMRAGAYAPFRTAQSKHTHQTHCIIGNRGYGLGDARRLPLSLLTNILGGPSANSLLNISLREKHGLSYNIEASYTPYTDDGIVLIYFSSDHGNADHCMELIHKQLKALCDQPLSSRALSTARKQFIAQMSISMESNEGYMLGAGKSYLVHNDMDTLDEAYAKVMAITAEEITEAARETFADMSYLIYK